jgi:hypothetical protein
MKTQTTVLMALLAATSIAGPVDLGYKAKRSGEATLSDKGLGVTWISDGIKGSAGFAWTGYPITDRLALKLVSVFETTNQYNRLYTGAMLSYQLVRLQQFGLTLLGGFKGIDMGSFTIPETRQLIFGIQFQVRFGQ